jgi:hypothetical protein
MESNPGLNIDADLKQILENSNNDSESNLPLSNSEFSNRNFSEQPIQPAESEPIIQDTPLAASQLTNNGNLRPTGNNKWLKAIYILIALVLLIWIILYLLGISISF